MKIKIHFFKLPFCSAEQHNAPSAYDAVKNKVQIFFNGLANIATKAILCLTLLLVTAAQVDGTISPCDFTLSFHHILSIEFIVMEGDMLLIDTGNALDKISIIEIFDSSLNLILTISGCNQNRCEINLSELDEGSYYVKYESTSGTNYDWISKT